MRGHVKKSRRFIFALEDVLTVFDDVCIRKLTANAKLPQDANLDAFGWWIREAACMFASDTRIPTANELHDEIAILYKAAQGQSFEQTADLLERLSPEAREMLRTLSLRLALPAPRDLREKATREEACHAVASLCRIGGQLVEGRRRPTGKRSRRVLRPILFAPEPRRHFPRRDAERQFVSRLSDAWRNAAGVAPSRTARWGPTRDLGPFASFVSECLRLVGAGDADAVELINELHRGRRVKKKPNG